MDRIVHQDFESRSPPMSPNLSIYYLRCAIAGIVGGLLLVGSPGLGMQREGVFLILIGALAGLFWLRNPNPLANKVDRPARDVRGPSFDIHDRDPAIETPTTSRLIDEIRLNRRRQKRAKG